MAGDRVGSELKLGSGPGPDQGPIYSQENARAWVATRTVDYNCDYDYSMASISALILTLTWAMI